MPPVSMWLKLSGNSDDTSSPSEFEKKNLQEEEFENGRIWWYVLFIPAMKLMSAWVVCKEKIGSLLNFDPRRTSILIDRENAWTKDLIQHATEWVTLDKQYPLTNASFADFLQSDKTKDVIDAVWMKYMLHTQGVRNRFQIVKYLLEKNVRRLTESGKEEIRVLGLASGSGRDIIETLNNLRRSQLELPRIKVLLLDHNRNAVEKANELAETYGLTSQVECIRETIRSGQPKKLEESVKSFRPDIVYNIGFFDYKPDQIVIDLKRAIRRGLTEEGVLISGNIMPNPEKSFLKEVINWAPMFHRNPDDFVQLLKYSGYPEGNIYVEPNEVFVIGEAFTSR